MLSLAAGEFIAGIGQTAATITYTISGDDGTLAAGAFTAHAPKTLQQGQLPSGATALHTVAASHTSLIKKIHLRNTSASAQSYEIYLGGTAAANRLFGGVIPANGSVTYAEEMWATYDANGVLQYVGSTGPAATVTVGTTTTGIPGSAANVTNSGNTSAAIFNFTIPAGAVFRSGSGVPSNGTGVDGDWYIRTSNGDLYTRSGGTYSVIMNLVGAAATVAVGTTTTLAPGSAATVGNSGSSSAAVFNFGIPAGAVWRSGSGVPSNGTGLDGDYYLRTNNGDVYLRSGGTYSVIMNLVGPAGAVNSITSTGGSITVTGTTTTNVELANIPSGTPALGSILSTAIVAPGTPAAGKGIVYVDSTGKVLAIKNDAGVVSHTVRTQASVVNQWIKTIADDGSVTTTQPAIADVSGLSADLATRALDSAVVHNTGAENVNGVKSLLARVGVALGLKFTAQAAPAYDTGALVYDSDSESLTFFNNNSNISLQIGQKEWLRVYNATGSTIANGAAVYVSGVDAATSLPTVALAVGSSGATAICAGLAAHSIGNNSIGYITVLGLVRGIDTNVFSPGAIVYVDPSTPGSLTATAPVAPYFRYRVGTVVRQSSSLGSIYVTPSTADLGLGTANQLRGVNAAGTASEFKTLSGTGGNVSVTHGAGTITVDLVNTIAASTVGDATHIPVLTYDAKGRLTAASTSVAVVVPGARTLTTTAPLTIDGGASADLSVNRTLAISPATISTPGSQSAADKARQDNFAKAQVSILDFGADNTGVASSVTPLANAIAALPAAGGIVFFAPGVYDLTGAAAIAKDYVVLLGASRYNTVLKTTSTTADLINVTANYVLLEDLYFTGPGSAGTPTSTAGNLVNGSAGVWMKLRNCVFAYGFNHVNMSNQLSSIEDGSHHYYFKNSGIIINHNSDHQITGYNCDNLASPTPTGGGIVITNAASLLLDSCNIIHANVCLDVAPGAGVTVPSIKAVNCFFDSSNIGLRMVSAGSFFRSEFTNCWFSSMATAGIQFGPSTAGQNVDGISFLNCDIYNNVGGTTAGVSITTGNVGKWKMIGCNIAGWTTGIALIGGAGHFPTLVGNSIGAIAAFGVNTTGITVAAGTYKGLLMKANDVVDNTTALTLGAVTASAWGNYRIVDNAGINPRGNTGIASPALGTTATVHTNNTGFRLMVFAKMPATSTTTLTTGGATTAVFLASQMVTFVLEPGQTAQWNVVIPASWVWVGL